MGRTATDPCRHHGQLPREKNAQAGTFMAPNGSASTVTLQTEAMAELTPAVFEAIATQISTATA